MGVCRVPRIVLVAVLASTLFLCGCADVREFISRYIVTTSADSYLTELRSSAFPKVSASATKREGILTVGLRNSQTPPLIVAEDDKVKGLDVDVACALADELGLRVEFVNIDDVAAALQGPCDVVMGVGVNEAHGFDVVGDYVESAVALFQHGSDAPQATAEQVRAARIVIQEGSAAQLALRQMGLAVSEVTSPSLTAAFDVLARGEADYVACNSAAGMYLCSMRGGMSLAGTLDTPTALGVATNSGESEFRTAFGEAYARIQTNGVLATVRQPWLGTSAPLLPNVQIQNLVAPVEVIAPVEAPVPGEEIEAGANAVTF